MHRPEDHDPLWRVRQIISPYGPLPVGRTKFYSMVASGELPRPVKIGKRISAWRRSDIIAFIENGGRR